METNIYSIFTINDTPPDVTCIQDITRIVTIDSTGTTVSWTEPTATDNSGVVSLQSRSHAPGDFFSPGTTQVTYIFVDPSGQTANCIFTVTVTPEDNVPPVVSCIPDVTETTSLGTGGRTVLFTEPTATNDSGAVSLQQRTHGPGTFFSSGVTQVTYIFVDPAGNTAECTFRVIVTEMDNIPPVVSCINDITQEIPLNSFGFVVEFTEPTATDNSGTASVLSATRRPGQFFQTGTTTVTYIFADPSGNTADCVFDIIVVEAKNPRSRNFFSSGVTQVTYIFVDPAGNTAECTFRVIVTEIDTIPPVVACVGLDVTENIPLNGFGTTVQFREPTATDNSGTVNLQSRTNNPGQFFQSGSTTVTYIFEDPSGNTATCTFCVDVVEVDNIPPVVSCISDIAREIPLNSFGVVVQFTEPTATDNSGTASVLSATQRPGQFFQTGTTTVTYIFADPSGNTADCVFDISVVEVDDTPPDVTCIQDITRTVTIDSTGTTVFWTEPTATDNSGVVSLQSRSHAPGEFFSPGTTQVTYIFVDPSGQTAFCTFTVTVTPEDNVLPVVSCIPDVTETTPLGTGGRLVFYTEPTATDDPGVVSLQQRTHGPGTFFSSGVTQVTYIFVDPAGNTAECTFRVIVTEIDTIPPVVACVGLDVTENIPLNGFGTTVQFREPTATDNSGTVNLQSRTNNPGQFFQSGSTTVTYIFEDPSGNTATCTFCVDVVEVDNIPPVVSCISDIAREIPLNSFGVVVQFTEPTATDNSGTASVLSATQRPGQFFQTGTTTVTYIFADPSGNTADCVFDISVVEVDDTPPDVTCIQDITRTVTIDSTGTTVFWTEPTATDNSGVVSLQSRSHAPGEFFSPGTTQVTYIFVDPSGQTAFCTFTVTVTPAKNPRSRNFFSSGVTQVTYIFVDPAGNTAECTFRVIVTEIDTIPPVVACVGLDVTENIPLNGFGTTVQFREPTATDNSGTVNLQSRTNNPGQFFQSGSTTVTYIFEDPSGNTATCTFCVDVVEVDNIPPVVSCISDIAREIPLNSFGVVVQFTEPTATDNSGTASVLSATQRPGQFFQTGTTTVTYIFADPSGNTADCVFDISVVEVDDTPPDVTCIQDITRTVTIDSTGTTVFWTEPTATDNSGVVSLQSRSHAPGEFFSPGTTQVTYIFVDPSGQTAFCTFTVTVTPAKNPRSRNFFSSGVTQVTYIFVDPAGNTAECTFRVIVTEIDTIPPVVACVGLDVTENIPLNGFGTTVQFREPTATDNSGTVNLQSRTNNPGQFFQSGSTTVTYIFEDPSGNTATCTFCVDVVEVDNIPPVVSCISDIAREIPLNSFGVVVQFTEPTATDNSGTASVLSATQRPGQFFQTGTTTVTYIFADPSGNTADCVFDISVVEEENVLPVVSCIPDVTETTPLGTGGRLVFYTEPTATDDSGVVSLQQRTHGPGTFFSSGVTQVTYIFVDPLETLLNVHSGSLSLKSGTTEVTYVFIDPSGNTAECSFNIIITEVDNIPPVVSCINDITREIPLNSFGVVVEFTEPTATDNSGTASVLSATPRPGQFFQTGTTTVTYIFADPSGSTADCVFDIIVVEIDDTPPDVTCIQDITRIVTIDSTGTTVSWTEPTATDNSGVVSLQSRSHAPGEFFSTGTTQVTYIFVDPSGQTAFCSFTVTVTPVDQVPPVIACVGLDVTETIPLNGFGTTVQFSEPTATDNSGTANVQSRTHTPGQFFQSGTTEVTYVFADLSGNTAECSFNIIITEVDNIPPVVSCINDITQEIPLNSFGVVVEFTEPTATDNSGTASVLSATRRPGQFFQTGTTTVTYIFADPSGNTADCVFDITVVEATYVEFSAEILGEVMLRSPVAQNNEYISNILNSYIVGESYSYVKINELEQTLKYLFIV
ncbi:putative hyalin [Apostichopus japonicus]|uniref:Putative hyalin n=1 Tax=Stichopus japonicus TaxID=307972 RepID=A0A2G8L897_STIJA|nr:putative hyalin [Apostichopus japonicus]